MFLNILRISALNVLKMFVNTLAGTGSAVVIFHSYKPTGSINTLYSRYPGRQEYFKQHSNK